MCFQEEGSPMEFPWGFNETTIRETSRVATTYARGFLLPMDQGLLRTKIPLLRYRCIALLVDIYIYIGIRCSFGGRNDPLSGDPLGFISHPRARILDYSDFQLWEHEDSGENRSKTS